MIFCFMNLTFFFFSFSFLLSSTISSNPEMPEATDSVPVTPVAAVPRKGTVQIIDGKKVIFDENGKP